MYSIGQTIIAKGVELTIHAFDGQEYELRSVRTCGVWFATPEQLQNVLS